MPLTLLNEVICRLSDGEPKSAPYAGVWETSTLSPRRLADRIAGGVGSGVCPAPPHPTLVCILPPLPSHRGEWPSAARQSSRLPVRGRSSTFAAPDLPRGPPASARCAPNYNRRLPAAVPFPPSPASAR